MSENVQVAIIKSVASQSDMLKKHLLVESADEFKWSPLPSIRMQGDVQVVEYPVSGNHNQSCVLIAVFDPNFKPAKLLSLAARFRGTVAEGDLGIGFTIVGDKEYLEQQKVIETARKRLIEARVEQQIKASNNDDDREEQNNEPTAAEIAAQIRQERLNQQSSTPPPYSSAFGLVLFVFFTLLFSGGTSVSSLNCLKQTSVPFATAAACT